MLGQIFCYIRNLYLVFVKKKIRGYVSMSKILWGFFLKKLINLMIT